jgi:hypothetical protein
MQPVARLEVPDDADISIAAGDALDDRQALALFETDLYRWARAM